jgi:hypothetical protein
MAECSNIFCSTRLAYVPTKNKVVALQGFGHFTVKTFAGAAFRTAGFPAKFRPGYCKAKLKKCFTFFGRPHTRFQIVIVGYALVGELLGCGGIFRVVFA